MLPRRRALALVGALALGAFVPAADAGVARAFTLAELAGASSRIVVALPLEAWSRWETSGKRRRIVTYTRVAIDEALDGGPAGDEVLVRTLGGRVGKIGQIIHGEALLLAGERAVLFLRESREGEHEVTGMAQGHFPLSADARGVLRLMPSPRLSHLTGAEGSAIRALAGKTVDDCARAVIAARVGR